MASIRRRLSGLLAILTLILASQQLLLQIDANSSPTSSVFDGQQVNLAKLEQRLRASEASITTNTDQLIRQAFPHQPLSQEGLAFDASQFKSVYEAIRAHPDLREFASLVDSKGVREIVSTDNIALTVFAPIDRSLGDLLAKSKSRSINLIDLAKHHIAQGFVMPNDDMKFPFRFQSFAGLESPLYLNKISTGATHSNGIYVNNAKVIASYLIQIDQDNYQTLHLIDEPLEFAYVNRRTQFRAHQQPKSSGQLSAQMSSTGGAGRPASSGSSKQQFASVKRALQLDDLVTSEADELNEQTKAAILEFGERFGDLLANQAQLHLYRTRSLTAPNQQQPPQQQRLNLVNSRDQLQYERLAGKLLESDHLDVSLRGRLYNLTESSGSFNTYFLPIRERSLEQLLDGSLDLQDLNLALQAHIIPDQVLFTRTMPLGQLHPTSLSRAAQSNSVPLQVSLGLAKALPRGIMRGNKLEASSDDEERSRQLLSSPLLVQAKCELNPEAGVGASQQGQTRFRLGLTQSEVLLANIPLANGVLHLISKPLVAQPVSLLDYINDNNQRLSNFVQALGSQSGPYGRAGPLGGPAVEVNKFRELLVRDHRQLSATFSSDQNRTLLAPSDEAFSRLRYDLRALIYGDESMTPSHWDPTYRQDLLRRLVERHIIPEQVITSGSIMRQSSREIGHTDSVASQNGQLMSFRAADENEIEIDCGPGSSARARLLHRDLTGSNGIMHVIDQVLGEEQETVHSLLSSLVLSYSVQLKRDHHHHQSGPSAQSSPSEELRELIDQALNQIGSNVEHAPMDANSLQGFHSINQAGVDSRRAVQESSPELAAISKTIGQYLEGLSSARRQLLASSVNVSFHLAKLVSRAEGADDWNEKFQQPERSFTYFVPNDLAWFKLQQRHPELYKPLAYFLSQQQQHHSNPAGEQQQALVVAGQQETPGAGSVPRSSESSHRLLQILERHLIGNKKLNSAELNSGEQHLQTLGASLRLVDNQNSDQLHSVERTLTTTSSGQTGGVSAFAALHSIISGVSGQSSEQQPRSILFNGQTGGAIKRALEFGSTQANILQAYETSNGFVYLIDNVLILPEDPDYIVQTSSTPASSSTMSSLLGGHNSLLLDLVQGIFSPSSNQMSTNTIMALIGTLIVAIVALTFVAMVLIVRRYRQNKSLNRHQQLESGLTSSSSANSGSTSTTKSL